MNTLSWTLSLATATLFAACASHPSPGSPQDAAPGQAPATAEPDWELGELYGNTGHRQISTPVSQLVTFESPVVDTSLRPIFIWHEFPNDSIFGGGHLNLYALQIRVALSERLGIIATKDGWIDIRPNSLPDTDGWANLAAGLKYSFIDDPRSHFLFSGGITYEAPTGNTDVFQGEGDGILRFFVSAAKELDDIDLIGSFAYSQPLNRSANSTSIDYHGQINYEVTRQLVPFFAMHGITYVDDGGRTPVNFEGVDLVNLGSTMVSGQSVFSGGVGARYRFTPDISAAASYDFPIGGRKDILEQRVTVDMIFHF